VFLAKKNSDFFHTHISVISSGGRRAIEVEKSLKPSDLARDVSTSLDVTKQSSWRTLIEAGLKPVAPRNAQSSSFIGFVQSESLNLLLATIK
jgi:hypothetical protein